MNTILFPDDSQNNIEDIIEVETPEYSCGDPKGYFLVENAFSELQDEYLRRKARENLGITESGEVSQSTEWGNIKGNIKKLEDLVQFVYSKAYSDTALKEIRSFPEILYTDGLDYTSINFTWTYKDDVKVSDQYVTLYNSYGTVETEQQLSDNERSWTFEIVLGPVTMKLSYKFGDTYYSQSLTVLDLPTIKYYGENGIVRTTHSTNFTYNPGNSYMYIILLRNRDYKIAVDGVIGGFELVLDNGATLLYKSVHKNLGPLNISLV